MNDLTWRGYGHGPVPTPCVGVCAMDAASGFCTGCARTTEEIGAWQGASEAERRAIWAFLPKRRDALGLTSWRLPWTAREAAAFAATTLREPMGTWSLGLPGVSASFLASHKTRISFSPEEMIAQHAGHAFRLRIHEKTAAFAYSPDMRGERLAVGLALPKGRVNLPVCDVLTPMGRDADAISHVDRSSCLFDLGLGLAAVRVLLRTGDPELQAKLCALAGRTLPHVAGELAQLRGADLTLIVETGLGRIETVALPDFATLAATALLSAGWPLHQAFLPCAQFLTHDTAALNALLSA
jgi:predicted Fe-S protein YdhL (DUF1289 family)